MKVTILLANTLKKYKNAEGGVVALKKDEENSVKIAGQEIKHSDIVNSYINILSGTRVKYVDNRNEADFYIMLVSTQEFCSEKLYQEFAKSEFRCKNDETLYNPKPFVFISTLNFLRDYKNKGANR